MEGKLPKMTLPELRKFLFIRFGENDTRKNGIKDVTCHFFSPIFYHEISNLKLFMNI